MLVYFCSRKKFPVLIYHCAYTFSLLHFCERNFRGGGTGCLGGNKEIWCLSFKNITYQEQQLLDNFVKSAHVKTTDVGEKQLGMSQDFI